MNQDPYRLMKRVSPVVITPIEDGRLGDLATGIGENSFDFTALLDTDVSELRARQHIFQWLLDNQSILNADFFKRSSHYEQSFPSSYHDFFAYSQQVEEQKTAFWNHVTDFHSAAHALYELPQGIIDLNQAIQREGRVQYLEEQQICQKIMSELRRVISIQGILRFDGEYNSKTGLTFKPKLWRRWNSGKKEIACYGTQVYHPRLDPKITDGYYFIPGFLQACGFQKTATKLQKHIEKKKQIAPAQLHKTPLAIIEDVLKYLNDLFSPSKGFLLREPFRLTVGYRFNGDGLYVTLLDWEITNSRSGARNLLDKSDFGEGANEYLITYYMEKHDKILRSREYKKENAFMNNFFVENADWQKAESYETYRRFCGPRLNELLLKYKDSISVVCAWQEKVKTAFADLVQLQQISKSVRAIQNSGLPYCFPEFSEDGHLEVRRCYPIRLRDKVADAVSPFKHMELNGQIVNLTGRNGSGKTSLELTLLDLQILAQCGLPVFAEFARIPIRSHILLSFLDRSSKESTYKAKLKKDMDMIRVIKELRASGKHANILAIIDELGSATDQVDVLHVTKPFIRWFAQQDASLIISTQIYELSEFVGTDCDGLNLIIKPDYSLEKGIGKGEPFQVAQEMGFFELIES